MKLRFFVFASVLLLPYFVQAKVFINEIAWMGSLPKGEETSTQAANNEWIELYNDGEKSVDLTGWTLAAEDGIPTITFEEVIQADSYFLLERTDDDSVPGIKADKIYAGALGNSGEILFLKDANNIVIDKVSSQSEWLWGNNTTKETMQRVGENWVTANPTPRVANTGTVQNVPTSDNQSNSGEDESPISNNQATSPVVISSIKPYAGEDKVVIVGSQVEFSGYAFGFDNKPIDNARFWWNFGDGQTKEGRAVSHIFQIPGKYTVGLHISEEHFAASDYLSIEVIPNKIYIKKVVVGEGGFIQLANPDNNVIDIGGWIVEDFKRESFIVPVKTIIGAKSEIALANDTTGLFKNRIEYPVIIRYPNLREAFQYKSSDSDETIMKIASEKIEPIQKTDQISPDINISAAGFLENKTEEGSEIEKYDSANTEISQNPKKEDRAQVLNEDSFDLNLFFWFAFAISIVSGIGYFVIKNFYF